MSEAVSATLSPISVLIVDDHRMFAESLARLLAADADITVVGIATSASVAFALAEETHPRVALVDYQMPGQDGLEIVTELKRRTPDLLVLMLSGVVDETVLLRAIEAGCIGYLTKDRAAAEVATAIRAAAAGEALISPVLLARLLAKLNHGADALGSDLTERERQVLNLLAEGRTNALIAAELHLSVNTVRNYVQAILTKLGVHSKLEAVSTAVREGIIYYPEPH
jgi:two-component system, NarL family, response regulator DevR